MLINTYCAAIDIGASSGRVMLAEFDGNRIILNEAYRFLNKMDYDGSHYYWDIDSLFDEILKGLNSAAKINATISSASLDTWGVDYVLLDETDNRVSPVFAYRDHRTDNTMSEVFKLLPSDEIYAKTGIQFMQFNTLFQLFEHAKDSQAVGRTKTLLMVPDYLLFLLSGEKASEFTIASTSQICNVYNRTWDEQLVTFTKFSPSVFQKIIKPGTALGRLKKDLENITGLKDVRVIAAASHDTAAAVASVPVTDGCQPFAYISSGTWSLMGIESASPNCSEKALAYNFTNEGGVNDTYRFLKNIMGLWLIQEVARLYENKYSFGQLAQLAAEAEPFVCIINPNAQRFMNPLNMIDEIKSYCTESNQPMPSSPGQLARCIFDSLALQYKDVMNQLEDITGRSIPRIHIIGGGSQNKLLNQLCADYTKRQVYAGPVEATALGNVAMQLITLGYISDIAKAREIIAGSFTVEEYAPRQAQGLDEAYDRFKKLVAKDKSF